MMRLYSDGGSRGNPGEAAIGFVIYDKNEVVYEKARPIGIATNNIAEYTALLEGLEALICLGVQDVEAFLDSELVVKQIKGEYKVKNQELKVIFDRIKDKINNFKSFSINHVKRAYNKEADRILNIALDTMTTFENGSLINSLSKASVEESNNAFRLDTIDGALRKKVEDIKNYIKKDKKVVVAFSGGVDSSLLINLCKEVLKDEVVAVTVKGPHIPESEFNEAVKLANAIGIKHEIVEEDILSIKEVREGDLRRCYYCKSFVFKYIDDYAKKIGATAVYDGSNIDDLSDYRPGMQALEELHVKSPFLETNWTKSDIREYSKLLGMKTHDKEAAACLISRVSYGQTLTKEILTRIDKAEAYLKSKGLRNVRVRVHDDLARIEMNSDDLKPFINLDLFKEANEYLKNLGFKYVSLDLGGYKTGNMNK